MVYGGELNNIHSLSIIRLSDGAPQLPRSSPLRIPSSGSFRTPALQASYSSVKFLLPRTLPTGVFVVDFGGEPLILNKPQIEWCQPTLLLPGLSQNQAAPGSTIQIIGRNFLLASNDAAHVKVVLQNGFGACIFLVVESVDKYSVKARIPESMAPGLYRLWVHNGHGGPSAWGGGKIVSVKLPASWPSKTFNIKAFGARGDDVADDSAAMRSALAAAAASGGGIVYFPAGTYRLKGWFFIPQKVSLRGEQRGVTFLKWPETLPSSPAGFLSAALYSAGQIDIENLTLVALNAETILRDLSWDADQTNTAPVPALRRYITPARRPRDIFLRNVDFQLLYYAPRPTAAARDPRWLLNGFGWKDNALIKIIAIKGVTNFEITDCRLVGGTQDLTDLVNARLVRDHFDNEWASLSWTSLGGQYVIFEHNFIHGASGWSFAQTALRYLYCAYNHSTNIVSGEREALTFDINGVLGRTAPIRWGARTLPPVAPLRAQVAGATPSAVSLVGAHMQPHIYHGLDLLIVRGPGAGETRTVADNTANALRVSVPWTVAPARDSEVLVFQLPGRSIFYRNDAEDTSVLFEIWGFLYDCTFDGNRVTRSQGMWGLSGWFIQWLNNDIKVAVTYHPGVGPAGAAPAITPEGGEPFGFLGFVVAGAFSAQSDSWPAVRACVIRANRLSYSNRVLIKYGYGGAEVNAGHAVAKDIIIDRNIIENAAVGIDVDSNATGVLIDNNSFQKVANPLKVHLAPGVLVLDRQ
jgi:hypothetical protein